MAGRVTLLGATLSIVLFGVRLIDLPIGSGYCFSGYSVTWTKRLVLK